ncbi:TD and POZ domain-containing protein 5 [Orchesella cincta]|uniref:TD and POZ domain-containing protein 5 n=1 Tax=Orchesella cincta TaxID=48709 RepID=A0A1D2MT31_ORCCI|nr:TD and POZ domain-containing protein 5 [Orchesella cincta]
MTAPAAGNRVEYADNDKEIERCTFEWVIPGFKQIFSTLNQKSPRPERNANGSVPPRRVGDESKYKLYSETFVRGQLVQRTSLWQLELRNNVTYLSLGLCCLKCFHENVDEIWTRFDTDIVDFNGKCLYSVRSSEHYSKANISKFTPNDKLGEKQDEKKKGRVSFWETDLMRMSKLADDLETYAPRGILNLRLRLYIYKREPFNESFHLSEYRDPVKLCYTDTTSELSATSTSKHPLLNAVKNMWHTKAEADVSFLVEGNIVRAHRFIISVQSLALKGIVNSQTNQNTPIVIPNMALRPFEQVLKYLYLHEAEDLKESTDIQHITAVLTASNRLDVPSLGRICCVRLLLNMTPDNFAETAMAIYKNLKNNPSFFKREIGKFLFENQAAIKNTEAFKQQMQNSTDIFMDLYFGFSQLD